MLTKRAFLMSGAAVTVMSAAGAAPPDPRPNHRRAEPFPLEAVTLTPSIWRRAVETNIRYLKSLEPDRFLHNFHKSAGLPTKGELYGGWETMGIAGHSLGHYLSACALGFAQTRDGALKALIDDTVAEMARIQAAHGDGYIGGTTVERDGKTVDGKIVFEEVRNHIITSHGFDLNGGWVPLYTWHKVHAGLLDAHRYAANPQALEIAVKMSDYLIGVLDGLSDEEMQQVLAAEHGGLNESFAETYARTKDARYLAMARRLYHQAILTPLAQGRDELAGKHANTQIPKLIGLARLYEITGEDSYARTARFFWDRVVRHHSFVIGGNSTGEHFGKPDHLAHRIDDKTCEACNSYNMLKLTRHLFAWQPDASWFDFFERAHLNHIMAHQDPDSGAFVYFMPLAAGSQRLYSTPFDSFWCCVGSGMESHAKHGDSIYWRGGDTLYVNLFIPSELSWADKNVKIALSGDVMADEPIVVRMTGHADFTLALRLPAWCGKPALSVNGKPAKIEPTRGYAMLRRTWRDGDSVVLHLPQYLHTESMPDDPRLTAYLKGPMVLCGDMGPAEGETPQAPVVLADNALAAVFADKTIYLNAKPQTLRLVPFFSQYHRRSAVYFPRFTQEQWLAEKDAWRQKLAAKAALAARTIDAMRLGEMQPERDHAFATETAEPTSRLGQSGRWLPWSDGRDFSFALAVDPSADLLQLTYWGDEVNRTFDIFVDDALLKSETLALTPTQNFRPIAYKLPKTMIAGKDKIRVRIVTRNTSISLFEARTLRPAAAPIQ